MTDEHGFFDVFFAAWAEQYNGTPASFTPTLDRALMTPVATAPVPKEQPKGFMMMPSGAKKPEAEAEAPAPAPAAAEAPAPREAAPAKVEQAIPTPEPPRVFGNATITFTQEDLLHLKAKHSAKTRQQGLIAALWQALGFENLSLPVNVRGNEARWTPALPRSYFGNGVVHGFCSAGQPVDQGIPDAASARAQHEWLADSVKDLSHFVVSDMDPSNLLVSSWAHMEICPTFGESKPRLCLEAPMWPAQVIVVTDSQAPGGAFDVVCARDSAEKVSALKP